MSECTHASTYITYGDTWRDSNGNWHTVIYLKCANHGCPRYGKTVRVKQTGDDMPVTSMPPFTPLGKP